MTFQHYIITRFNVSLEPAGHSKVCTREYLDYRFPLFEQFCLPSVIGQTCQDFKWLVLFDSNTPNDFLQRADNIHKRYPNFIPCHLDVSRYTKEPFFINHVGDIETDQCLCGILSLFIKECINRITPVVPDFYVTTRLDSDDGLHHDMVATIQQKVKRNAQFVAYDFVYSYKYILNERIAYRYPLLNGHFITLVEPSSESLRSVYFCNHLHIDKFVSIEHFYQRPLQTELIHDGNVVNDFTELTISGLLYALLHFHGRDFGYAFLEYSYKRAFYILAFLIKERIRCFRR